MFFRVIWERKTGRRRGSETIIIAYIYPCGDSGHMNNRCCLINACTNDMDSELMPSDVSHILVPWELVAETVLLII